MAEFLDVRWGSTPRPDTPEWAPFAGQEKGDCGSCGKHTFLRADPVVGQMACRPCWEALMFDD